MIKKVNSQKNFAIVISALMIVSCTPAPPVAPPNYSAAPPAIDQGFHIENQETIEINVPREHLLNWLDQTNLSDILTATEGMPSVKDTVVLEGEEWGDVGNRRRIELSDGHYAVETILKRTDERLYYQVWGFTSQAGQFAEYATGKFIYNDQNDTTLVTWTYRFKPNSYIARLPLSYFVNTSFQRFMENGLARMKKGAEESYLQIVPR